MGYYFVITLSFSEFVVLSGPLWLKNSKIIPFWSVDEETGLLLLQKLSRLEKNNANINTMTTGQTPLRLYYMTESSRITSLSVEAVSN